MARLVFDRLPLLAVFVVARALAAPNEHPETKPRVAHPVRFEADRLELDPTRDELVLDGNVSVTVSRYWLGSDRLRLKRTPRGVLVEGNGRVAFCPCPAPPVSLGFQSALVAPPTDLLLEQPTVRVGSVPVLWLPYLWLRSRHRPGLLPPMLAWRARDGLLAGGGAHLPLSDESESYLDVRAAGYFLGGVDLETRLDSATTTARLRWDRLREDLVVADARGFVHERDGAVVAWSVDAIRGARASGGPLLLEEIARRSDRLEISAGRSAGFVTGGVGLRADAVRGGSLDDPGTMGPQTIAGWSSPLSSAGAVETSMGMRMMHSGGERATALATQDGGLFLFATPTVVGLGAEARTRAVAVVEEESGNAIGAAGVRAFAEVPFSKRWKNGMNHAVTPTISAGAQWSTDPRGSVVPWLWAPGGSIHASAGADTILGDYSSREGARSSFRIGYVGKANDPTPTAHLGTVAWARYVAASFDVGLTRDPTPDVAALGRVRVGAAGSVQVRGSIAGQTRAMTDPRILADGGWDAVSTPWFDAQGWSSGAGLQIPWASWLATAIDADFDHTVPRVLGVRGATGYRHPCGCLAILAKGSQRFGRPGIDASVSVDLVP